MQALLDDPDFHTDQTDLDALDFKSDLSEDYVMVRRLVITRADPIRNMKLPEKVRERGGRGRGREGMTCHRITSWCGGWSSPGQTPSAT